MAKKHAALIRLLYCLIWTLAPVTLTSLARADNVADYEGAEPSGWITMSGVHKMPPLEQRDIDKLALLLDLRPATDFVYIGFTIFQNRRFQSDQPALITDAAVANHFQEFFVENSTIALVDLTPEKKDILPFINFSTWTSTATVDDDPSVNARIDELLGEGVDAIMLVQETESEDFYGRSGELIGAKGLYGRGKTVRVFGIFSVRLIDIRTRKEMKNSHFLQGSTKLTEALPLRSSYAEYSDDERRQLSLELDGIYTFNVQQAMRTLKADHVGSARE